MNTYQIRANITCTPDELQLLFAALRGVTMTGQIAAHLIDPLSDSLRGLLTTEAVQWVDQLLAEQFEPRIENFNARATNLVGDLISGAIPPDEPPQPGQC